MKRLFDVLIWVPNTRLKTGHYVEFRSAGKFSRQSYAEDLCKNNDYTERVDEQPEKGSYAVIEIYNEGDQEPVDRIYFVKK